jgi:nucleoside diphosphate kinase
MPAELAYALITPHSLHKSRTGGIITRLIARTGVEFIAGRMFGPSRELAEQYAEQIVSANDPQDRQVQELIRDYVLDQFAPEPKTERRRRVMLLLFKGEDAVRQVYSVVGTFRAGRRGGQSIRDTYGDFILDPEGNIRYFEPAVLAAPTLAEVESKLRLWARYSDQDGGVLHDVVEYGPEEKPERTLVLLKPDNFRFASGRPGNMIDFFSRTGLFIVGIKLYRMSVAGAMEFYGPVRDILRTKFKDVVAAQAKSALEEKLGFKIPQAEERRLGELLGPLFGDNQFENIVEFMSGMRPSQANPSQITHPGTEKCIALIYEGIKAVSKIRDVLGPTDPSKAPAGSIRREFGSSIMVNAAHASDSEENARREMDIVDVGENSFKRAVEEFYGKV